MIDVPIEVKEILQDGRHTKNFRFNVLKDDGTVDFVIDNNALVSETVNFDERMCSGDTLKFGLCEGSSLEFQYFDHPNINGRQIQCFIDIAYGDNQTCSIPMGYFTVAKCSRQASTGIIKVTAYNKLQSNYLDQKANTLLLETLSKDMTISMFDIRYLLLNDYQIVQQREAAPYSNPTQVTPSIFTPLGTFGFTKLWGIENPINPYNLQSSEDFTLLINSSSIDYLLPFDPDNVKNINFDARFGTLIGLEYNLVNFIKKLIDEAKLTSDGDTAINTICSGSGFQNVIGINHTYARQQGSQIIYVTDTFSTIQWEYEEKNNIAHTVQGKIADIMALFSSGGQWTINIPVELTKNLDTVCPFDGQGTYEYYLDESMVHLMNADYPFLTFSDNTRYQEYDGESELYGILPWQYTNLSDADNINVTVSSMPDFTLRDITSAVYETLCQFGQLDRQTDLFFGAELNHERLFPAEDLYPNNTLYPGGAALSSYKSMYSKLWGDEGNVQKWRYLIITYKGLEDGQEKEFTLQRTVNADGNVDYNCSDNWIFKNLTWSASQVGDYADAMVAKMRAVTWFPFEMWCAGLPYLETGDEIEVSIGESTYTTYILQRQLKGIQNLQDTYINGTLDIF